MAGNFTWNLFSHQYRIWHLINKCSSSSTASHLHCLHILFSTAVFGIVYLPLSISSLCALIRKHARVDRFDNSFILSKYFSCWNINLNLKYVRYLFSFLLVTRFCLTKFNYFWKFTYTYLIIELAFSKFTYTYLVNLLQNITPFTFICTLKMVIVCIIICL